MQILCTLMSDQYGSGKRVHGAISLCPYSQSELVLTGSRCYFPSLPASSSRGSNFEVIDDPIQSLKSWNRFMSKSRYGILMGNSKLNWIKGAKFSHIPVLIITEFI